MKYFSHFRFDRSERKLWLGPDAVPLTRKAADLLAVLIQDAGSTVSHQKILEDVWPDTHVQQDNIKVLVHELRHALGDSPEAPRYVQSEAGRGYSFVAAVADAPCPMLEGSGHSHPPSIARDYVMTAIDGALDAALNRREAAHLYFEGIAGSGKTTVCQEIYRRASRWPSVRVAYGRAHRTSTEPFPAIVTDRQGNPVTDLKLEDFQNGHRERFTECLRQRQYDAHRHHQRHCRRRHAWHLDCREHGFRRRGE